MSPFWPGAHYSPVWASSSWQSSCLWLPGTNITSIDQHSQLQLNFCIPCPDHSSPPATFPVALPQGPFHSSSLTLCPVAAQEGSQLDFQPYLSSPPSPSRSLWQFYYAEFLMNISFMLKTLETSSQYRSSSCPAAEKDQLCSAKLFSVLPASLLVRSGSLSQLPPHHPWFIKKSRWNWSCFTLLTSPPLSVWTGVKYLSRDITMEFLSGSSLKQKP